MLTYILKRSQYSTIVDICTPYTSEENYCTTNHFGPLSEERSWLFGCFTTFTGSRTDHGIRYPQLWIRVYFYRYWFTCMPMGSKYGIFLSLTFILMTQIDTGTKYFLSNLLWWQWVPVPVPVHFLLLTLKTMGERYIFLWIALMTMGKRYSLPRWQWV
jgi:hypothetical protein